MMGSTAATFTRPHLTRTCRVCSWMNLLTVLQSDVVAMSSKFQLWQTRTLKTEERFPVPDGLGTSWNVNFHRVSSEVMYVWSHLEKQLAIYLHVHSLSCIRHDSNVGWVELSIKFWRSLDESENICRLLSIVREYVTFYVFLPCFVRFLELCFSPIGCRIVNWVTPPTSKQLNWTV